MTPKMRNAGPLTGAGAANHQIAARPERQDNPTGTTDNKVGRKRKLSPATRTELDALRRSWRSWKTGVGLHIDYTLQPGTDDGDCATAYRAERRAEIEQRAAELKGGAS